MSNKLSKKLSSFLVVMLAAVAFGAIPAVALAELQFMVNGKPAGTTHTNVTQWGTLKMKSPFWGEMTCKVIVGAPVWNESGKPLAAYEGWEPFVCQAPELERKPGKVFVTAETAVQLIERENTHKEKIYEAKRGGATLPWPAFPLTTSEGTKALHIGNTEKLPVEPLKFIVDAPAELFEVPYEGTLQPRWINGTKNGLKASRLEFEGEGGKTGHLISPAIFGGKEPEALLYIQGELTMLGSGQQLITAE
jgi:hypothetical protein